MKIELKNISYQYPQTDVSLFENLNCDLTGPGFNALFGHSGIGKTTLARIMARELSGYSGNIEYDGIFDVLYTHNMERFPGWASVGELISSATSPSGLSKLDTIAEIFGMEPYMKSRFSQLSLGQKNRANLIRYLLQDFDLLIMDESLANVDETTRGKIITSLKTLFTEKCFLYISHNMFEVAKFCNQIAVLRSVHKKPQILTVTGQNLMSDEFFSMQALEQTMLEIVHAS